MYYITLKTICGNFFGTVATFFKKNLHSENPKAFKVQIYLFL